MADTHQFASRNQLHIAINALHYSFYEFEGVREDYNLHFNFLHACTSIVFFRALVQSEICNYFLQNIAVNSICSKEEREINGLFKTITRLKDDELILASLMKKKNGKLKSEENFYRILEEAPGIILKKIDFTFTELEEYNALYKTLIEEFKIISLFRHYLVHGCFKENCSEEDFEKYYFFKKGCIQQDKVINVSYSFSKLSINLIKTFLIISGFGYNTFNRIQNINDSFNFVDIILHSSPTPITFPKKLIIKMLSDNDLTNEKEILENHLKDIHD